MSVLVIFHLQIWLWIDYLLCLLEDSRHVRQFFRRNIHLDIVLSLLNGMFFRRAIDSIKLLSVINDYVTKYWIPIREIFEKVMQLLNREISRECKSLA
jgi:hypothetical protein